MEFIQQLFIRELDAVMADEQENGHAHTDEEVLKEVIRRVKNQLRAYSELVDWASISIKE